MAWSFCVDQGGLKLSKIHLALLELKACAATPYYWNTDFYYNMYGMHVQLSRFTENRYSGKNMAFSIEALPSALPLASDTRSGLLIHWYPCIVGGSWLTSHLHLQGTCVCVHFSG